jgi:dUTP pyrophosphatase
MLSGKELSNHMLGDQPLVDEFVDYRTQVGSNGVDLTLRSVWTFAGRGAVDFDNSHRQLPGTKVLEFNSRGWLHLKPGPYKVTYNEVVNIPKTMIGIARPRSTLLRCGATIETAVWDAGYSGRSESLLQVFNPFGLEVQRNARVVQLLLFMLSRKVNRGYSGKYQRENVESKLKSRASI